MSGSDLHILEFLWNDGNPIRANPSTISANIDYRPNTVRKRLGKLRDVGLVEYYDQPGGIYKVSALGERYLENDLSDDEVSELESAYERLSD